MTSKSGYALLAALIAFVALVCAAILVAFGGSGTTPRPMADLPGKGPTASPAAGSWVGAWAAAPAAGEPGTADGYPGMTIRDIVHTTIEGTAARVELSNLFGTTPLTLTHVTLAVAEAPSSPAAAPGSLTALAFAGQPSVSIPAGRAVVSDPVRLTVPAAADLLVSLYAPYASGPVTFHPTARQTSYLAPGDQADDTTGTPFTLPSPYWRYVTAVDVWTPGARGTVVAFGDSITDGLYSTTNANDRWPDFLAARLRPSPNGPRMGVVNEGISGNRLLPNGAPGPATDGPSGLLRLRRDALSRTGVRTVIVDIGINDIIEGPRPADAASIIAGLRAVTREAHAHGVRVLGATLLPFAGHAGYTPRLNVIREQVNTAIRSGTVFDAVVDFDGALRDPRRPDRLLPAYDSGDHLHPSDAGYRAMAHAIDLRELLGPVPTAL